MPDPNSSGTDQISQYSCQTPYLHICGLQLGVSDATFYTWKRWAADGSRAGSRDGERTGGSDEADAPGAGDLTNQ